MPKIDLNCDMGESWYDQIVGQDEALMPFITSCNLACGVHGGDADTMQNAVDLAILHGVNIGAHPSLPGRQNFGRETINLPEAELTQLVFTQIDTLITVTRERGVLLTHIKPHGALYHLAASQPKEALAIVGAARYFEVAKIYGPPGSLLQKITERAGLQFVPEGFIDRTYENGQELRSRKLPDSIIHDAATAAKQAHSIAMKQELTDYYGKQHSVRVNTLCVHGDHAEAVQNLLAVRDILGM